MNSPYENDATVLINGLLDVINANAGFEADSINQNKAEALCLKFFFHIVTVLNLYKQGSNYIANPGETYFFIDHSSINIVCRAAYENLLTLNYLFILPKSEDEKEFRYLCWEYSGLLWRGKLKPSSSKFKKQVEDEKRQAVNLLSKIEKNAFYLRLNHQNKRRLKNGNWRLQSWREIGRESGLSESIVDETYSYLSGYSHSESIGSLQIRQADTLEDQRKLSKATVGIICIMTSFMIKSYCDLFPRSNVAIQGKEELQILINRYCEIGNKLKI